MSNISLIMLFISIITAFQCNSSVTEKKTGSKKTDYVNQYFPLADGNYWEYINEAPRDEAEIFTVKAKDTKKTESGNQLKVTSFPYLTKENTEQTLIVKSNGEVEAVNYFFTTGTFVPAPENFKAGYEWQFGIYKGYVYADTSTVQTETGKFENCNYVLMTEGFTFSFEMWYKKGVGIVKWGSHRTNPPAFKITYYVLSKYYVQ